MLSIKTKISTPAMDATRAFYESVFGLGVVEEWDEPGDRGVILALPERSQEALLEIYACESAQRFDGLSLQFRVASLERFIDGLDASVSYEGPTPRPWGSTYLYLRDPNDIAIIVYEGGL